MEIKIEVKGKVQFSTDWSELRKAEHYIEGRGLYAMVEEDAVVGLVDVQGFDDEKGQALINSFTFPPSVILTSMKESMKADLMEHIQQCCDKVCGTVKYHDEKACEQYNNVMEGLKGIHDKIEEGGSGNGISEKTLLDALRIVHSSQN